MGPLARDEEKFRQFRHGLGRGLESGGIEGAAAHEGGVVANLIRRFGADDEAGDAL